MIFEFFKIIFSSKEDLKINNFLDFKSLNPTPSILEIELVGEELQKYEANCV